ncbi:MAG: cation diffusion facilitator family transporter [Hyphomicrobiales bacterium]|nr:cation diffusion facilitator family transporter [Hyphomicrobiales bacterium]MCY4052445.1 cation diffusion facilitator family transporter [Hyphomicrobiales bacterium]
MSVERSAKPATLMRRAAMFAVATATTLILTKGVIWWWSDSVALLGSLLDSILDALASLINLVAVRQATTPADKEHRFGHGKAEALAGLGQAVLILFSALFVTFEAVRHLLNPRAIEHSSLVMGVMILATILTLLLIAYQRYVVRRSGSLAIRADSLHYIGDTAINLGVLIAVALSAGLGWLLADPLIALAIAGVIFWSAWGIARQSFDQLMDRELDDSERQKIKDIALAHGQVLGIHDLRTRRSGLHRFVQFHIELPPEMPLREAHRISDEVEANVKAEFADTQVLIHQDPAGIEEAHGFEHA